MRYTKKGPPQHVGLIMDGNGRWAERKNLPRSAGHIAGARALESIIAAAPELGVRELTAYVWSTENWARPRSEVDHIMKTFGEYLARAEERARKEHVKICIVGDRHDERLSTQLHEAITRIEAVTKGGHKLQVNLAFNYGGDADLAHAAMASAAYARAHGMDPSQIGPVLFREHLHSSEVSDMDLLIRTGGEQRLSNFFPVQTRYAELYFSQTCWPAFNVSRFKKAIEEFQERNRTFGGQTQDRQVA